MDSTNEHTSDEKKHWVRINGTCNNRCAFCLDRDTMDGKIRTMESVEADLRLGVERGASRAIISGGEASIHPQFTEIVATAKGMGYGWIQTITNGRMFYYRDFMDRAVRAGLKEVTFSMHGHTPELFERLTGVPGSFKQALGGIRNALSVPGLVVSVDIVVCAINAPFLKDIVKFYHALGVNEYDLLYPVPFGNAWRNRGDILSGRQEVAEAVAGVLPLGEQLGLTIWTNRFPAKALEGFEGFIQSPGKMHDEVYGRSEMFSDFMERGEPQVCVGERCEFCNMADFCAMLESERDAAAEGRKRVYVVKEENAAALDSLEAETVSGIVLDPPSLKDHPSVHRILSDSNIPVTYVYREIPEEFDTGTFENEEVEIALNKRTAPMLLAHGIPEAPGAPVRIALDNYASAEECAEDAVSIRVFFKHLDIPETAPANLVCNVPPCVSQNGGFVSLERVTPGLMTPGKGWCLEALADYFILYHCYHKSARCGGCPHFGECPGLHINYIRTFGFAEIAGPQACRKS